MSRREAGLGLFVDRIGPHHLHGQREHGSAVAALDGLVDDGPAGSRVDAEVQWVQLLVLTKTVHVAVSDRLPQVALDDSAEEWCHQCPLSLVRRQYLLK